MLASISQIREKITVSGTNEASLLNKRKDTLKKVLKSFDQRLALLTQEDKDALLSVLYEEIIGATFSCYLFAEEKIAMKAIRQSRSWEEECAIERDVTKRVTALGLLCDESS